MKGITTFFAVLVFSGIFSQRMTAQANVEEFHALTDQYLQQVYLKYQPSQGTTLGFHQFDTQLENLSRQTIQQQISGLHAFERKVSAFPPDRLDGSTQADRQLVLNNIHSTLLTLETIRPWEKNPDTYSSGITASLFTLMERKFAPPEDRLRSLIAREKQVPAFLEAARRNLQNPPRIYTEIALEQLPGNIDFIRNDVTAAFASVEDKQLKGEFAETNARVLSALEEYRDWLRSDVLPRSHGDFRIGADVFSRKLAYDEMVDLPLSQLLNIGYGDLHKNQAEFRRIAKELDPSKTPEQILLELGRDHPAPSELLASFRDTFTGLIKFIQEKRIITIPSDVRPTLEETPPFMRATTFASMDTPGPFERVAKEAYFNVTLPEKSWRPERTEGFMHMFNVGTIVSTSVHEAYPGHYVQFLWVQEAPSAVRKVLGAASNAEGWAHYCEQMMLEEGFGQPGNGAKDLRQSKMIQLGQLQDALLRDARFIVGIKMHTGQMTFDQAVEFFQKEGFQSKETGEVETKRGTADPTYLYYTLGKLEILKLRADLKKRQGAEFSLEKFHNNFMRQGFPPIKVVRKAMLGDDSPVI
ncbi:MAG: DUF885 domain-containing protein [Acidobacteriaceae bacterium]|nr:DUF885 domain-containing protein [Acidobacteriaceae bacterium]